MREGMERGIVQPKTVVEALLPRYKSLYSANASASVYLKPISNFPASFSQADRQALSTEYLDVITNRLNPAMGRLATFLESDYLHAARTSSGWDALPNGAEWYRALIKAQTSIDLAPDQIHQMGQAEVVRIQKEFETLGPKLGYTGSSAGLPVWVSQQGKFKQFTTEQEILDAFLKLNASLEDKLPALFALRPKSPLEVRLEPPLTRTTASDHYVPGAPDGSRPGVFWAVVVDPKKYSNTGMATLMLHEGRPGHHFQQSLLQEMHLPAFRRRFFLNSYVEGWALYAETLGRELGVFDDPAAYFGHLNAELGRSARLVVDTGIHAMGWSRERAIKYLQDTLGNDEPTAKNATERYMAWPAQALTYKIGEMKIMELRQQAEKSLGSKFNLADFHAVVLSDGAVPLPVLEAKVERWISQKQNGR